MSAVDEGLEAQIRNSEEKYGKPLSEWIALVRNSGLTKHSEIVVMLKSQYGISHGSAHRVALTERLESAASFNALFTHRVRVNNINDVDEQLISWLKQAYDLAG
jgi:uncharacterized protein DUF4287/uncharacterized protein DUF5655